MHEITSLFLTGLNVYTFLTVRAICSQGLDSILAMKTDLEENRSEASGAGSTNSVYKSDDFRNLYNLMAHEDSLSSEDWFLRTLVAVFIIRFSSTKCSLLVTNHKDLRNSIIVSFAVAYSVSSMSLA